MRDVNEDLRDPSRSSLWTKDAQHKSFFHFKFTGSIFFLWIFAIEDILVIKLSLLGWRRSGDTSMRLAGGGRSVEMVGEGLTRVSLLAGQQDS